MFDECVIRNRRFTPARFCAPLVGYTHSAFRRLLAELGGCGAIWTEMLSARQILSENFGTSPWLRCHSQKDLVYQLMVSAEDPIERVLGLLQDAGADSLDLNLACNARSVRSCSAGSALFEDFDSLGLVLQRVRKQWPHVLTVKIRLGHERPDWQPRFVQRVRLIEEAGADAIILHPRFFGERFKRRARHEFFPWLASLTKLPVIANGDITRPGDLKKCEEHFQAVSAIMLGRMAVAQPWIFATWDQPAPVNFAAVWDKMYQYITEDFPPSPALRRLQMFTKYFAANFRFGHQFNVELARAASLPELRTRAHEFFARSPAVESHPTIAGL